MDLELQNGYHSGFSHLEDSDKRGKWRDIVLAYRTLGVVFGGLVTSPLYVYPSMNLESPTEEDYLGIYSIIFWTLTLIGVVKYVCIALNADDHGEGGTFALYSLLCRHTNIGILPSKRIGADLSHSNRLISSESQSRLGKFLEHSITARRIVLFIAMLGVCMLIGDGILTPAISVLSAMDGLRGPFPSVHKSAVEALSAVILIVLFLLQKFGTSRVSFLFSPIMGAWTFTTPIIGVYSFLRYYPGIFKTLSPHYIVSFFLRKGKTGWQLLGGTVLCITGAEAMFADLGHFNKRSIQIAFLFSIYPSLVLTYAGQTAYLIKHLDDHRDGFFKFVPDPVYWPMFIIATLAAIVASQSLISATFSVIKQSVVLDYFPRVKVVHTSQYKEGEVYSPETNYILMFLCVAVILGFGDGNSIGNAFGVVVILVMLITTILLTLVMIIIWRTPLILAGLYFVPFLILEGTYVSAVFTKFVEGGWLPFGVSVILASIMFGWYHGRQRKLEYEMTNKITLECLGDLLGRSDIQRVPGLCFFYSNIQDGLTPILGHYIQNMRSLHKVTIFTTLRYLLVAKVAPNERIIIRRFGLDGIYGCVVQYGYADSLAEEDDFVTQVINSLRTYIEMNSDRLSPLSISEEISQLEAAKSGGVVHVRGKTRFHIGKETRWFDRILLGFYEFLHSNCRSSLPTLAVPLQQRMEIGMLYEA
ncbi:probable potassium transporter 17 [Elaeis guineensis]|uniref:Potassium transporter n=1 Tax=Elaeis guineensis var. tenera TaxID=51953 RepID=A0A6I9RU83_ELAGV|nr:probable potassium transporter 17 [Elaeis guineensis]